MNSLRRALFALSALWTVSLFAVSPNPYTLPVNFTTRQWGSTSGATMSVYGEPGDSAAVAATTGGAESALKTAWLRPGKSYTVNIQGDGLTQYALSFNAPNGYATYVNGDPTDLVIINPPSTAWFYHNYTIELRPAAKGGRLDAGAFTGVDIGKSVSWEVGLGGLRSGRSAGRIMFRELDLSNSPASRDRLYYSPPYSWGQTTVVNDGPAGQTLRQVMTPQVLVDLVDDAGGGYWIKFYAPTQGSWSGSIYTISGSPWKTLRVESPAAHQLKITETEGSVSGVSHLSLTSAGTSNGTGGSVTTGGGYTVHTFTSSGTFSLSAGTSVDFVAVAGGGGGGAEHAGGGGAGGLVAVNGLSLSSGSYGITIGGGGAGGSSWPYSGSSGGSTTAFGYTAIGGGYGAGANYLGAAGGNGGSGGGAGYSNPALGGAGTSGQGNSGNTTPIANTLYGGGGGGAGGAGNSSNGGAALTTWAGTFAGGGGGGYYGGAGGGGGAGSGGSGSSAGGSAAANTGSGGGGGGNYTAPGGNGGSGIVVIRYASSGMVSSGSYTWQLQEGDGSTWKRTTTHTSSVPASGQRDDVVVVRTGGTTGTIVSKTKYHYVTQPWGEELSQVVPDPDSSNPGERTTTYDYHTSTSAYGNYTKVKSISSPTGDWTGYVYYDDWDRRGQVQYEFHPYLSSTATPNTTNPAQDRVVSYDYDADWTGRKTLPRSREERINNSLSAKATSGYVLTNTAIGMPLTTENRSNYSGSSASEWVASHVFRPGAYSHPDLVGFLVQIENGADIRSSRMAYVGNYNPSTHAWDFSAYNEMLEVTVHGSRDGTGASLLASWLGMDFPHTWVLPNKSTMEIVVRNSAGLVLRTETHVCTGGTSFALLTWENYTYDSAGRLTQRVASNGATTSYTYTNGRLSSTVDSAGTETQFTYDELGRVATSVKKGAAASGSYAAQGDITTTYSYDGANRGTQTVVSGGSLSQTTTSAYDLAGRLTQTVAPGSYTTGFAYSSGGRVVTTTFPGGATKIAETHYDGQPKQVTGTGVVHEYFTHGVDGSGNRTLAWRRASSSTTAVTTTTHDWLGRKITFVQPGWNGSNTTRSWFYNSGGQLYKMSQPGLADTLYSYNTLGQLIREGLDTDASGTLDPASSDRITDRDESFFNSSGNWWRRQTSTAYATAGSSTPTQLGKVEVQISGLPSNRLNRTDTTDIFGNVTSQSVDVNRSGKLVTTTTDVPDSSTDSVQVAYNGLIVSSRSATNLTTTFGYDALGRASTSVDPRTGTTTTAYVSGTSQIYTVTDPASIVQATYTYDSAGRVSSVKDGANKYAYTSYTNRGEVYRQWGDTTYPVEYDYDNWGRRTTMKTYRGGSGWTGSTWPGSPGTADTTTWAYHEPTGLLSSKSDAASRTVSYTYTQAGQLYTRTWARGTVTTYGYSSTTGELTGTTYSDGTPSVSYTYNRMGKTATVADVTGTRTFNYFSSGALATQLENEVLPSGYYGDYRITRGYDTSTSGALGRYNRLAVGSSGSPYAYYDQGYGFDALGRLNSTLGAYTYTYLANSHLISGISHGSLAWSQTRTYLSTSNSLDVIETMSGSTSKARFDHAHDNLYRVLTVAKTGELFSSYGNGSQGLETDYAYNDRSEVTADSTALGGTVTPLTGRDDYHSYDPIGNRATVNRSGTAISYSVNALNQYTSFSGSGTHSYDYDGNLTSDGVWAYAYDGENRLIAQESPSVGRRVEYAYDWQNRRVRKLVREGWNGSSYTTVASDLKFVYDGNNLLFELNATTLAGVRAHVWGLDITGSLHGAGGVGGLLYSYDYATGTYHLPVFDGNGNIWGYVNGSGTLTARYEYDAFGQTIVATGSALAATPFRFSTKYSDADTGLVYYGLRYYSPSLGRFLNQDPISEQGGLNLYGFCSNNGVNKWDYLGMDDKKWNKASFNQALRDGGYRDANGNWHVVKSNGSLRILGAVFGIVASVITYGAASGFVTSSLAGSATSIGATWSATTVSIVSGTVAGAASGVVGQVVATGSTDNLGQAALSGAVFGGIAGGFGDTWNTTRVATNTVAGGLVAEANGGNFADGALTAGVQAVAAWGWDQTRQFTDEMGEKVAAADPSRQVYDSSGSLRTDGKTTVEQGPSFFGETADRVFAPIDRMLEGSGMANQGNGVHLYDSSPALARFVNQVSKAHDFWNGWNYSPNTGAYISRGSAFDAAFNTWSFSGMIPAAIYTAGALSPATPQIIANNRDNSRPPPRKSSPTDF